MRSLLAVLAAIALSGCGNKGADGFVYEGDEWLQHEYATRNVYYSSLSELRAYAPKEAQREGYELHAWARIVRGDQYFGGMLCEKHILEPSIRYRPEFIGHEDVHCMRGRWHK